MKRIFIILGGIVVILLAALLVIPYFFKDEIKRQIDLTLEKNINATIYYDFESFRLSFFRDFPNLTVSLSDFGVIGRDLFEGDTLVDVARFDLALAPLSVFKSPMTIKSVALQQPLINLITLEDGSVNYDITYPSDMPSDTTEEASSQEALIRIEKWEIVDGTFIYEDLKYRTFIGATGINHTGKGDIGMVEYNMALQAAIDQVYFEYYDVAYLSGQRVTTDMLLHINMDDWSFTFRENKNAINDFHFVVDGMFAMPDDMTFDLSFSTPDNSFKSLLSLVPEVYAHDFEGLDAEGNLSFSGAVKGKYTADIYPGLLFALKVDNGKIQYPDLPKAVEDIRIDMALQADEGGYTDLKLDINDFHARAGDNPLNLQLHTEGMHPMKVKADVDARFDLSELHEFYPLEGVKTAGLLEVRAVADGIYDSVNATLPAFDGMMRLSNGSVENDDLPRPLKDITMDASFSNSTGTLAGINVELKDLSMYLGDKAIGLKARVWDMDNPHWNFDFNGEFDLSLINAVAGLEGMSIEGIMRGMVSGSGDMNSLENEQYQNLPTSGNIELVDFLYVDSLNLPAGLNISRSNLSFSPTTIRLSVFDATSGNSDFKLTGNIENYLAFALAGDKLEGRLSMESQFIDVNSFLTTSEEVSTTVQDSAAIAVVRIPQNIEFTFNTSIKEVVYSTYSLSEVRGTVKAIDGQLLLQPLRFNMLEGAFVMNGSYDSRPELPLYDFDLNIENVAIPELYRNFVTIQRLSPVAEKMTGKMGTTFRIDGVLDENMSPVLSAINGYGAIRIQDASVAESKVISGITSLTRLNDADQVTLKDVDIDAKIADGNLEVSPFDIKLGKYTGTVSGKTFLDGTLAYKVSLDVPTGQAGSAVNNLVGSYLGNNIISDNIKLNLGISGTYNDPEIGIASIDNDGQHNVVDAARDNIQQTVTQKIAQQKDSVSVIVEESLNKEQEEIKEQAEEQINELKNRALEKLKKKRNN